MSEWEFVEYQSLAAQEKSSFSMGPFGSKITKENYTSSGVPLIRGNNLSNGIFHDDGFVFISEEKADDILPANVAPGDVIFTHRGTIGQVTMVPRSPRYDRYAIGSSQVKTRLDTTKALPEFYYYWFRSPRGQGSILANASTVGVPGIATPLTSIKKLSVPVPPLAEQKSIAATLGALDDKIAVNERIATTASDLSTSLFNLRTNSFRKVPISHIATPVLGGTPDRNEPEYWGGDILWASAKDVAKSEAGTLLDTEEKITHSATEKTRTKTVPAGSVIITARGTVGAVARITKAAALNQSCYAFIPGNITRSILYEIVLMASRESINVSHGTVFSTLNMKSFDHLLVPHIGKNQASAIEREIHPFHRSVEGVLKESRTLAELRDTLLPQLMSGKLRVKDAEKIVEDNV